MPNFDTYVREFNLALNQEIEAARKDGGQKIQVNNGDFLGKSNDRYIYTFTTDFELELPDDTQIYLLHQKEQIKGRIITVDSFTIILELITNVGRSVNFAMLLTEPWFLLEELKNRLEESKLRIQQEKVLAQSLLAQVEAQSSPNLEVAKERLNQVATELGKKLSYNNNQLLAIATVLSQPISFIWGPPGTGKTKTLGMAVAALVKAEQSVLVVAHSNAAVDVAMVSIAQNLVKSDDYQEGRVLRYGLSNSPELKNFPLLNVMRVVRRQNRELVDRIDNLREQLQFLTQQSNDVNRSAWEKQQTANQISQVQEKLRELKRELKDKQPELIRRANVVGCTLSKIAIAPEIYERRFDAVIVDEASMALIPYCFFASLLADQRVAVFGDFRQLGPICRSEESAAQSWLQRDIFEAAGIVDAVNREQKDTRLVMLQTQYRMHPDIASIPNDLFYGSKIQNGTNVIRDTANIINSAPNVGSALVFCDLTRLSAYCHIEQEGTSFFKLPSKSRFNFVSALIAVKLVLYVSAHSNLSVGIITPYNAQSRLINRLLKDLDVSDRQVKVATVHRFQGSERDLIIFDAVEGVPRRDAGKPLIGGLNSSAARLSNVAISRAKGKFIALVNYQYIKEKVNSFNYFRKLIERIRLRTNSHVLDWSSLNEVEDLKIPGVNFFQNSDEAFQVMEQDFETALKEISIHWPVKEHNLRQLLKCSVSNSIKIRISGKGSKVLTNRLPNCKSAHENLDLGYGIVGIDQKYLWIYFKPETGLGRVIRLSQPKTINLLYTFWNLIY